jgi:hypothetical protein
MTNTTSTTRKQPRSTKAMKRRITATGELSNGNVIRTSVEATTFDSVTTIDGDGFTATDLRQGRTYATAFNSPEGIGSHFDLTAHGVSLVEIQANSTGTGLTILVRTDEGQTTWINLFGCRGGDGVFGSLPIEVTDTRDA